MSRGRPVVTPGGSAPRSRPGRAAGGSPPTLGAVTQGPLVLVGPMGAGKSTVARELACRLRRRPVDLDAVVERTAGRPVARIFAEEGPEGFRRREAEALAAILDGDPGIVLATGGGVVCTPGNRRRLRGLPVVWLDAPDEVLAARVGADPARPLLAGGGRPGAGPAEVLGALRGEREPWYREVAAVRVETAGRSPADVADAVLEALGWTAHPRPWRRVEVPVDPASEVLIGPGVLGLLDSVIPGAVRRVAVVTQAGIGVDVEVGLPVVRAELPDGEGAKTLAQVERLCRSWVDAGLTRGDIVVAVGGGVVTDTAGFAAAVYHRGVPWIAVPTTLLGQIDAAVGGKTAVNLPEGKNLVGAVWQPRFVLCDTTTLGTLPEPELRSGLGELAKYHFLADPARPGERLGDPGDLDGDLTDAVAAAVAIKARHVAGDERESPLATGPGTRACLNYGHTLAHALEAATGFTIRHGEAVAVGLCYAAEVAHRLGRIDTARRDAHRGVVEAYGLPTRLPAGVDPEGLIDLFGRDKKAVGGVTLILDGPRGPEPVRGVPRDVLVEALDAVRPTASPVGGGSTGGDR